MSVSILKKGFCNCVGHLLGEYDRKPSAQGIYCENNPNCYYKNWQRKEQECEELEYDYQRQLKNTNKWIAGHENLQQQLDQLKAENEQLKKSVRSNKDKRKRALERYLKLKEFTNKKFQELKAELDKYKQLANSFESDFYNALNNKESKYIKQLEKTINKIRTERDELQAKLDDVLIVNYEAIAERYKQSLQEIFKCLIMADRADKLTTDTLWIDNSTTLWDYFALTLGLEGDQLEIEEQILQKCEVLDD